MAFVKNRSEDFHPEVRGTFKHDLVNHPLMQFDELRKLALRHPTLRYHSANLPRTQSLDTVLTDRPNGLTLEDSLNNISTSGTFVFIMDVQNDPLYAPLVNQILDEVQSDVEKHHRKMGNRQAWIFITSPGGVTPYHRDQEGTHYFHIKGKKTFWLWNAKDRDIVSQEENEYFHGVHGLKKTLYADAKMKKAEEFVIYPGDGIFFPYTAPHMVENGSDEYSISFSVTHMSANDLSTRRINKINQLLRKVGLNPRDLEQSKLIDQSKLLLHWILRTTLSPFSKNWSVNS